MQTKTSTSPPSPLTVWVELMKHVFLPGRDVNVEHDSRCDILIGLPQQCSCRTADNTARPGVTVSR